MERLTHLDDGRPVDLEFIRFRGDRLIMYGRAYPPQPGPVMIAPLVRRFHVDLRRQAERALCPADPPPDLGRTRGRSMPHAQLEGPSLPIIPTRTDVPVTVDKSRCIDGCRLCVDMCPLDSLAIHP